MILDMAMGGSTNTVLHILAIAHEAGVPFSLERIDALSKKTPNLCKVSPSSRYHIEDVARAGGIHTILGEVARGCPGLLDLSCMTVTGKTLGENIEEFDVRGAKAGAAARLLTQVRAGGQRTNEAWTVPASRPRPDRKSPGSPCSTPKAKTGDEPIAPGRRSRGPGQRPATTDSTPTTSSAPSRMPIRPPAG